MQNRIIKLIVSWSSRRILAYSGRSSLERPLLKGLNQRTEGGQLLPGNVIWHYRCGHLVLPEVLPGVTWSVRYLVLPGVTWVFILESFFLL